MSADPKDDALESQLDAQHDNAPGSEHKHGAQFEARRAEFRDQVAIARKNPSTSPSSRHTNDAPASAVSSSDARSPPAKWNGASA